jgi:hypothetical protein
VIVIGRCRFVIVIGRCRFVIVIGRCRFVIVIGRCRFAIVPPVQTCPEPKPRREPAELKHRRPDGRCGAGFGWAPWLLGYFCGMP